jgi:hypothetical protein
MQGLQECDNWILVPRIWVSAGNVSVITAPLDDLGIAVFRVDMRVEGKSSREPSEKSQFSEGYSS